MVGMGDAERHLPFTVDWKLHFSKEFYLCFQNQELWHMFSLRFLSRVFNLAIKIHGSRVSPSFFKAPTIESIIVILSVTCIVPKYYIVFCMLFILLVRNS